MGRKRVFIFGIDGGSLSLLEPWIEMGEIPTIGRFFKEGTRAVLKSTIPPLTAPAWTSFMTGKFPGKHGVYDFLKTNVKTYEKELPVSIIFVD